MGKKKKRDLDSEKLSLGSPVAPFKGLREQEPLGTLDHPFFSVKSSLKPPEWLSTQLRGPIVPPEIDIAKSHETPPTLPNWLKERELIEKPIGDRLETIENRLDDVKSIGARLKAIETRLEAIEARLATIEKLVSR